MNEIPKGAPIDPVSLKWIPNSGDYFPAPAVKRKDKYGKYDITTPKHLIDHDENYLAILTTAENRHPQEHEIITHYARQRAAIAAGTFDPMEDSPVLLRDLLPTVLVVVNKVFNKHELVVGGQDVVEKYVRSMQEYIDFDLAPVICGQPAVLPLHPQVPKKHRDPVYDAHMNTYYKGHDKGADDIMKRMQEARDESNRRKKEQLEREKVEHEAKVAARAAAKAAKAAEAAAAKAAAGASAAAAQSTTATTTSSSSGDGAAAAASSGASAAASAAEAPAGGS